MEKTTQSASSANRAGTRQVVMVGYPDAHVLDITGPLEIFGGARLFCDLKAPPYQISLVANQAGPLSTSSGVVVHADHSFAQLRRSRPEIDTLIISGGHGVLDARDDVELMAFIRWAAPRARRVESICTGAMILAQLGWLDGRRATTHWWWCPVLARDFPAVTVQADAIYLRDGNLWTSAGVTSGMDMALAMVEEDLGHSLALQIAQYNVMYMMRPGGQAQFSSHLIAQNADDPAIAGALEFIQHNLTDDLNVTRLAAAACMSERSFARHFKQETGMTPAHYVELTRLQAARVELEQSDHSIDQVSMNTGFAQAERMRRAFQRHLGISATEYRDRFRPDRSSRPEADP